MKKAFALLLILLLALPASLAAAQAVWTYELPLSVVTGEYTMLVNRNNKLAKDYKPEDLVSVNMRKRSSTVIELERVAAKALTQLYADASKVTSYEYQVKNSDGTWSTKTFSDSDGLKLLLISGYRSYSSQYTIYNNYLERNNGVDDGISAPPGASEHQTGLACDVLSVGYDNTHKYMNESYYETPEAQWLEANAYTYGFIIRYPKDKEDITMVPYEPWHLRYVGTEIAAYIQRTGLSYEEFTAQWQAALHAFQADGGDMQAQLLLEGSMVYSTLESTVLDIYGDDGDPEVSLTVI